MDMRKLIFYIIILFTIEIIPAKSFFKKSDEITRAENLIEEKKYQEAMSILLTQYTVDMKHQEYILKLIKKIEDEKSKLIEDTHAMVKLFDMQKYEEANELKKDMNLEGEFDTATNKILENAKKLENSLLLRNTFLDNMTGAEKALVEYDFEEAFTSFLSAREVYTVDQVEELVDFLVRLKERENLLESQELNFDFDAFQLQFSDESQDFLITIAYMESLFNELRTFTSELYVQEQIFSSLNDQVTVYMNQFEEYNLQLSSYKVVIGGYLSIIRRAIHRNYSVLFDILYAFYKKTEGVTEKNSETVTILKQIENFIAEKRLSYYNFYKMVVNFDNTRLIARSRNNLYRYADFNYKVDEISFFVSYHDLGYLLNDSEKVFDSFTIDKEQGDLLSAGDKLVQLDERSRQLQSMNDILTGMVENSVYEKDLFESELKLYEDLVKKVSEFNDKIVYENQSLENRKLKIQNLLSTANAQFNEAEELLASQRFDESKDKYNEAEANYLEIALLTTSSEVDNKISTIKRRLKQIEEEIFRKDILDAENFVLQARRYLYSEDYEKAGENIRDAVRLYRKHEQNTDAIESLSQRIETALQMKKETTLSFDDGTYKNIVEWFENAEKSLAKGDYDRAEMLKDRILSEKPYYEEARKLEIRILLAKGDEELFKQRFNVYYEEAMENYNIGNYTQALNGFEQLLEFKYDTQAINRMIYQCRDKLGLIRRTISEADKNAARKLVTNARNMYNDGDFEEALETVNQAVIIWEQVEGVSGLRTAILRRLRKPLPQLSVENEKKYARAIVAYNEGDYQLAVNLTDEIMQQQNISKVDGLNRKAKIRLDM